jgi:hypothetical protein
MAISLLRVATLSTLLACALFSEAAGGSAQGAAQAVPRGPVVAQTSKANPLIEAASTGDAEAVKSLLAHGASVDAIAADGRTALIAAAQRGQLQVVQVLVAAGAKLDFETRFDGTALNIAENNGNAQIVALLRAAGARPTGKSPGDTVCVRTWAGDGYCGTVKTFSVRSVKIQVTGIVGCADGCKASQECSEGRPVGGGNGVQRGEEVAVPSWCLTHTGVKQ